MAGREYAVVLALRAADYATAPIRAATGRLAAIRGQVAAFGRDALGTGKVVDGVTRLRGAVDGVAGHVRGILAPALAFVGAATGGSLTALAIRTAKVGDALGEMGERLGIGVERIQEWQHGAMRAGASNQDLERGLQRLNKSVGEAVNGTGAAKDVFAALGIKLKDASGRVKSTDRVFEELADKMARIPNEAERAAVASVLLGEEGGAKLVPMLAKGTAGLRAWAEEARRYGIITEDQAKTSGRFMDSMDNMGRAASGAANAIGVMLLPTIQPTVDRITEWVVANRDLVAGKVDVFVRQVAAAVDRIDIDRVIEGVTAFVSGIGTAIDWIGGWENALLGVAFVMASGPLASVAKLIGAVGQLGFAVAQVGVRFAIVFAGGVVGMVGSFVTALRTGVGVVRALNIALAANPIGAVVVGLTTLVGIGVTLYNTWKPFRDMIDWIVAKVAGLVKGAGSWIAKKLGFDLGGAPESGQDGGSPGDGAALPGVAPPGMAMPPTITGRQQAEVKIRLEAAPGTNAELLSSRESGGGMDLSTDLDVGRGRVAQN
ncbi:MAG: phage tail tape measure protein [Rhodospirillales bacterium]|nr:phage tail tape measure protein [Rhodospirillales bacterium]